MRTDFVLDALEQALYARQPGRDGALVCHSDRGSQDVSIRYTERLAEAGIEPSVGSKGDSYDNALAETINGLYKAELIHRRVPWKTRESVELATLEWVAWFNNHRLMAPLGYVPPAEYEANYYRQLEQQAMSAWLKRRGLHGSRGGSVMLVRDLFNAYCIIFTSAVRRMRVPCAPTPHTSAKPPCIWLSTEIAAYF